MGFIGGSLLEFVRDGQYGQFVEYVGDLATVAKLSGELVQVDVSELREVTGLQTPGQGGDERTGAQGVSLTRPIPFTRTGHPTRLGLAPFRCGHFRGRSIMPELQHMDVSIEAND